MDEIGLALYILGLSDTRPEDFTSGSLPGDFLLASIDVETNIVNVQDNPGRQNGEFVNVDIGIATLDSRDLVASAGHKKPADFISTFNIVCGSPKYIEKAQQKYAFGKPLVVAQDDLATAVNACVPPDRPIIIVAHDISNDKMLLRRLKILSQSPVVRVLDTSDVSLQYFNLDKDNRMNLGKLLHKLASTSRKLNLHNGGNDADHTLRALLYLSIRSCRETPGNKARLELLTAIAEEESWKITAAWKKIRPPPDPSFRGSNPEK